MFNYKFNDQQIQQYNNIQQQKLNNAKKIEHLISELIIKCPIESVVLSNDQNCVEDDIIAYYIKNYKKFIDDYLHANNIKLFEFIVTFKKLLMSDSNTVM